MLAYITTAIDIGARLASLGASFAPVAEQLYKVVKSKSSPTKADWDALAKIADEQTAIIQAKIP
jgi:hypothetical protein